MSEKQTESLSALMDGELDELAMQRLFNEMDKDPSVQQQWSRYHLARDAIKGDVSPFTNLDISAAVSQAISEEPTAKEQTTQKPWFKAVAGLSVAASVAFAIVIGARFNPLTQTSSDIELAGKTQVEVVTPDLTTFKSSSMVAQSTNGIEGLNEKELQEAQQRLNSYLKQHAQDSAIGQGKTAMPYARVVNFESSKEK
ncbi:anti sigma-E factor RseA C-terminal domain-containing protein [Oceaniserpentilla sp. 4NH20-0058]|uniref:sigma-E factor negative regulatory protein n=1 Tax=Oceaniserpentilla sp. 4NH20-0058 TaxID=3127660 RepID=UPI00310C260C